MSKIYLPSEYVNNSCKVVYNDYIRVFTNNSNTTWVDIYINQDYMLKEGYSTYSQNVICDNLNEYTDDYFYRTDIDKSLNILLIMSIFIVFIPIKIVSKFFRRGGL